MPVPNRSQLRVIPYSIGELALPEWHITARQGWPISSRPARAARHRRRAGPERHRLPRQYRSPVAIQPGSPPLAADFKASSSRVFPCVMRHDLAHPMLVTGRRGRIWLMRLTNSLTGEWCRKLHTAPNVIVRQPAVIRRFVYRCGVIQAAELNAFRQSPPGIADSWPNDFSPPGCRA